MQGHETSKRHNKTNINQYETIFIKNLKLVTEQLFAVSFQDAPLRSRGCCSHLNASTALEVVCPWESAGCCRPFKMGGQKLQVLKTVTKKCRWKCFMVKDVGSSSMYQAYVRTCTSTGGKRLNKSPKPILHERVQLFASISQVSHIHHVDMSDKMRSPQRSYGFSSSSISNMSSIWGWIGWLIILVSLTVSVSGTGFLFPNKRRSKNGIRRSFYQTPYYLSSHPFFFPRAPSSSPGKKNVDPSLPRRRRHHCSRAWTISFSVRCPFHPCGPQTMGNSTQPGHRIVTSDQSEEITIINHLLYIVIS